MFGKIFKKNNKYYYILFLLNIKKKKISSINLFVPNYTFDHEFVSKLHKKTNIILDTHLMILNPEEEVEKYITQIAFSGAEEFVEKYKGKSELEANGLIGHFGLGFFSSFMVSDLVEIKTKSFTDAKAVRWTCDGSTEYSIEEIEKAERGTEIIMHIDEESSEFLEEHRIISLLEKYCKFMPIEIRCESK